MATLNSGVPIRLPNGSSLRVYTGATTYDTVAYFVAGSFQFDAPGVGIVDVMDNNQLGHRIQGDERKVTGRITAKLTPKTLAGTGNLADALATAFDSDGDVTDKKVELRIPDKDGGTTGTSIIFNKFALPNGYSFRGQAQAEGSVDFPFDDFEVEPTIARY